MKEKSSLFSGISGSKLERDIVSGIRVLYNDIRYSNYFNFFHFGQGKAHLLSILTSKPEDLPFSYIVFFKTP